jgi:hypothetical protein
VVWGLFKAGIKLEARARAHTHTHTQKQIPFSITLDTTFCLNPFRDLGNLTRWQTYGYNVRSTCLHQVQKTRDCDYLLGLWHYIIVFSASWMWENRYILQLAVGRSNICPVNNEGTNKSRLTYLRKKWEMRFVVLSILRTQQAKSSCIRSLCSLTRDITFTFSFYFYTSATLILI